MSRHSESPATSPQLGASRYKSATSSQPLQARHYAYVRYMDAPYDTQRLAVLAVDFRRALPREFTDLAPPFGRHVADRPRPSPVGPVDDRDRTLFRTELLRAGLTEQNSKRSRSR